MTLDELAKVREERDEHMRELCRWKSTFDEDGEIREEPLTRRAAGIELFGEETATRLFKDGCERCGKRRKEGQRYCGAACSLLAEMGNE